MWDGMEPEQTAKVTQSNTVMYCTCYIVIPMLLVVNTMNYNRPLLISGWSLRIHISAITRSSLLLTNDGREILHGRAGLQQHLIPYRAILYSLHPRLPTPWHPPLPTPRSPRKHKLPRKQSRTVPRQRARARVRARAGRMGRPMGQPPSPRI